MPAAVIAQCKKLQKSLRRHIKLRESGKMKSIAERGGRLVDITDEILTSDKAQLKTVERILAEATGARRRPADAKQVASFDAARAFCGEDQHAP